ncbi:MAG: hypothetical protein R2680_01125 [Nitrososphaeraceae archaeon]
MTLQDLRMICNPYSLKIKGIASAKHDIPLVHSAHIQDIPERPI